LTYASIGNIEARVFGCSTPKSLSGQRGVIGLNTAVPVVTEYFWSPDNVLVLHTDGLSNKWRWDDFPELAGAAAAHSAQYLLQKLARNDDDATVAVVRKRQGRNPDGRPIPIGRPSGFLPAVPQHLSCCLEAMHR
jgi:serine/threonine protein phosphatase PrpC